MNDGSVGRHSVSIHHHVLIRVACSIRSQGTHTQGLIHYLPHVTVCVCVFIVYDTTLCISSNTIWGKELH